MNLILCTFLSMMSCFPYNFVLKHERHTFTNNRVTHISILTLLITRRKIYLALRQFLSLYYVSTTFSLIFRPYHNHHCHGFTHGLRILNTGSILLIEFCLSGTWKTSIDKNETRKKVKDNSIKNVREMWQAN